jgi:Mrp family chromosome partitioning ATPase/capsular polysaccharide biosynthesis protein
MCEILSPRRNPVGWELEVRGFADIPDSGWTKPPELGDNQSGFVGDRMADLGAGPSPNAPVPRPDAGEGALAPYLRAIRARWYLVALATIAAVAGSLVLLSTSSRDYEATAKLYVAPVERNDRTFLGLRVLRDSNDPARVVQTAATLVESPEAADLTAKRLGGDWTQARVLRAVRVEPLGQSSVLAVIARAHKPEVAADVANTFARSSLDTRSMALQKQLTAMIEQLRASSAAEQPTRRRPSSAVSQRIVELEAVRRAGVDPTLSLTQPATPEDSALGASTTLIIVAALLAGLALGAVLAVAVDARDPRVSDQDDLVRLYPLPILAGVPRMPRQSWRPSSRLQSEAVEAFRSLRVQLQHLGTGRAILVTSASSGDGKTTVAANLAFAFVEAGQRVALMDFDLRSPQLARAVGAPLDAELPADRQPVIADGVRPVFVECPEAPGLKVLARSEETSLESLVERLPQLLLDALSVAEYVIIDAPPIGELSDAYRIAPQVDDVVLVARPRHTQRASLRIARDMLERAGVVPRGILVVGQTLDGYYTSRRYLTRERAASEPVPDRPPMP